MPWETVIGQSLRFIKRLTLHCESAIFTWSVLSSCTAQLVQLRRTDQLIDLRSVRECTHGGKFKVAGEKATTDGPDGSAKRTARG